ncbi:ankyrin repeat domain-containing protein [Brachyspira hyodysenteriae]|nr:ankyrin repeat domain-containing protein [Brachyspira hyodysenteriae]MDA1470030.1 ankyrin repeat domain-containing protein [Brachyspira hyodysenteriae]
MKRVKNGSINKLIECIEKNIDINKFDDEGFSALMLACIFNKYDSGRSINKNKADINLKTSENWTALMFASFYGNYKIAELLLKNNACFNIKNKTRL